MGWGQQLGKVVATAGGGWGSSWVQFKVSIVKQPLTSTETHEDQFPAAGQPSVRVVRDGGATGTDTTLS